jgi:cellulose synthase/poly-beta-1,6-N-acetylglucosamine synthase-like glycosyltransferase
VDTTYDRQQQSAAPRRAQATLSLGQMLLRAGVITTAQLDAALATQRATGARIGEILVSMGALRGDTLARTIAEQQGFEVFDPWQFTPDTTLRELDWDGWYREHRLILIPALDGTLRVATADPINPALLDTIQRRTGRPVVPLVASERDIEQGLHSLHEQTNLHLSTARLLEEAPEDSAHEVLTRRQRLGAVALLALFAACLLRDWLTTITVLVSVVTVIHIAASLYRLNLLRLGWAMRQEEETPDIATLDDRELPIYTILTPLYREEAVLKQLTDAIQAIDWPKAKLDVRILLEQDDIATIAAARAARLPSYFTFVIVPPGGPQGKPKACNCGLIHARGDYVVIYDAEDIPEPDQLKKVYATFRAAAPTIACVQCQLNFYNPEQNLLTRWFTAEYSMWFDLLLPGLQRANVPIPLGGTANHFSRRVLDDLGAWDPYNVTEDADLGVRLFKHGYRTTVLDSTTFEEANPRVGNWLRQRSRRIKGYVLTWLVHMRHPVALWRALGPRAFIEFQFMIGGNGYVLLLNPIYWLLTALWFPTHARLIETIFPGPIYFLAAFALYIGNFVFVYAGMVGALDRGRYRLVKYSLLSPLYWVLMSIAAWKGTLQLFYAPNYWEKTEHGLGHAPESLRAAIEREARDG